MGRYLDFENEKYEKGFKPFYLSKENVRANIGKRICFVRKWSIDPHRGYYKVEHATIHSMKYSTLYIGEEDSIDVRDVVECGIELSGISELKNQVK